MTLQRYMFVNNDDDTIIIEIKSYDNTAIYYMLPEGDEEGYEEEIDFQEIQGSNQYVEFEMYIPAGEIWGFGVWNTPEFTNPDPTHLTIVSGSGKNPWPTPPPPPPPPYDRTGYSTRAANFLMALAGEREEPRTRSMPIAAAPPGEPAPKIRQVKRVKKVELKPTGTR
jgi:hypothetical protein